MKFIVALLLTGLIAFIAGLYFDWWSLAIVAFLIAILIHQQPGKAFLAAFLALFLLWAGLSWMIDLKNESILSARISTLIGIGNNPMLLVLITGLIAGLLAGMAALSGSYLRGGKKVK